MKNSAFSSHHSSFLRENRIWYNGSMHQSHPHFSFIRAFTAAFLLSGLAILFAAQGELCLASLLGSTSGAIGQCTLNGNEVASLTDGLHSAAELENTMRLQWQMILGMSMILGGFLCHLAYVRLHKKSPAQQTVKPKMVGIMK